MSKRLGVVLVFEPGTERTIAQGLVDKMIRDGVVDERLSTPVQSFAPDKGAPVWYIP